MSRPLRRASSSVSAPSPGPISTTRSLAVGASSATIARRAPLGRERWPHDAPAAWVPHCTLAMDLGSVTAATALALAAELPLPLEARLDRVGIVEFRPVRERFARPLTGRAGAPRP